MGNIKIWFVLLAVYASRQNFVEGQGVLQIQPEVGLSDIRTPQKGPSSPFVNQQHASINENKDVLDDQTLEWRLPREVIPSVYHVKISPNIDPDQPEVGKQWFVPGEVNITVQAQRTTSHIVMHSKNISINTITVSEGSSNIPVVNFTFGNHDYLNISLGETLRQGSVYTISINFTSYITTELNGLYRSSYINPDTGNRTWLATTQMEALHARQMMPCFDEPALKSEFHFTIGHMEKYLALFNTNSTGKTPGPTGWVWETYLPTVKMSTYLLALIISEFTFTEAPGTVLPGKKVRTYAPDHYIRDKSGIYAAENAEKILAFFGNYFSQPYPLDKMDSAAVPDFFFGAMENYGLNIYRESLLLVFPGVTLESERWSTSSVLAHELAHQWYGNLVSPAFWTHIWLNEGFATYFASVGAAHTNPEYEPRKRFLNDAVQRSMEVAADPNSAHSVKIGEMEWKEKDPMDWFDRMAYEQAGSLIRMMDGFLTTPVFTGGLKTYLNRMQYKAATQDDLFSDLTNAADIGNKLPTNLTMKDIMETWTLKAGFPLVRVSRASANRIYVSQEKFTNNAGAITAANHVVDELWHIPIAIATKSSPSFDPQPKLWLDKNVAMTSWEINANEWIILNAGSTGYYRVVYDVPLTNLIKSQLDADHTVIDPLTRSQLQDDYFTSAYQRYINLATTLDLTSYLSGETEIVVWNTVLKHFRKALNLFGSSSSSDFSNLRSYLLPRIKGALNSTGGVGKEFAERAGMPILRHQQFLDWACALEDEECRNFAVAQINQWNSTKNNTILRDIQQIVYCSAVAKGNDDVFQFIKQRYNDTTTTSIQKSRLLNALACATESASIQELLEGALTDNYFNSKSHGTSVLQRLAMTTVGRTALLRFVRENAPEIKARFENGEVFASIYETASTYVGTPAELQTLEVIAIEIADSMDDVKSKIEKSLSIVRDNVAWMNEFGASFSAYFSSHN